MSVEVLKYGGFLLMVADHLNRYLLWDQAWIEQAGRAVFPMFAMVLGEGLRRGWVADQLKTRAGRQVVPLVLIGVLAHVATLPLISLGVRDGTLNVLFTLAAGCVLIASWRGSWSDWLCFGLALFASWWCEYGPIGALLVFAAWARMAWLVWLLLLLLSISQWSLVPAAVPFLVWAVDELTRGESMRSPKRLFAVGYVAQWALVSGLVWALGA